MKLFKKTNQGGEKKQLPQNINLTQENCKKLRKEESLNTENKCSNEGCIKLHRNQEIKNVREK